jgi:ubiquinone/menaquinone biosynthesis C-methylase UbiE
MAEQLTTLTQDFIRANRERDYTIYTRLMDAALEAKAKSIFPHFGEIHTGDVIVDAGSGTGKLAEYAAQLCRGARVYALDISHELLEQAGRNRSLIHLVYGDASEQNFPDNSVKAKYYSTVCHEINSFGEKGSLKKVVENSFQEVAPGGRLIIRDFAKPTSKEPVFMQIAEDGRLPQIPDEIKTEDIDYSLYSARALFDRFHKEFTVRKDPTREFAFDFEEVEIDGVKYIKIDPEWAHEFYLRKDYVANWRQEIREKYTFWTMEEAKAEMEAAGFTHVQIVPDPNEFILKNRLVGKIGLYTMKDGKLAAIPFPTTHMVVVGEKPGSAQSAGQGEISAVDYTEVLKTIIANETEGTLQIGEKQFNVLPRPMVGSKKTIYRLKDQPGKLLKVVRPDTLNNHNAFKSMYQIVERQEVLEEHHVPHTKITEVDTEKPFRFVIQDEIPEGSECAATLILEGTLTETDIGQMAGIINDFEKGKEWQLDTNPYSWFRVHNADGTTAMTYVSGKVYRYDEEWEFRKLGLLQWLDPKYVKNAPFYSASIPTLEEYEKLKEKWQTDDPALREWKLSLDKSVQPE